MRRQTRQRRRNTRRRSGIGKAQWVLYALVFIAATITWWQSCHADNNRVEVASSVTNNPDSRRLMDVAMPVQQKGVIIEYPGFVVNFNADKHIPNYVAWELTRDKLNGSVKRENNFRTDESVEGCATTDDYRRSGYDRGHMAPAADMKWSRESMDACFYLTNICPQSKKLNTGSWRSLEEASRRWAERDSALVIICGPILTDRLTKTIGATGVTVPQRFFKVVLAPYANPPRGIAFVMSNVVQPGGMQTAATSIDHVEQITGMDFFGALDDIVEQDVESQNNFAQWQKRR